MSQMYSRNSFGTFAYGGCPQNFFDCGNDRCIAQFWRCDGEDDCGNWADEQQCHNLKTKPHVVHECPVNQSNCNDTHSTCVPNKWLCDGMDDCSNGADEQNCTVSAVECAGFLCHNFDCIPNSWRCNGIPECDDNEDEDDCPNVETQHNCDKAHGFYHCLTGECISHSKVCDHKKDCPQGDDESLKNCKQSVTTPKPTVTSTTDKILLRPVHKDVVLEIHTSDQEVHKYSEFFFIIMALCVIALIIRKIQKANPNLRQRFILMKTKGTPQSITV